jgi:putative transposase
VRIAQGEAQRNPGSDSEPDARPVGPVEPFRDRCGRIRFHMAHTYCSSLFHCVFSTKERRRIIVPGVQERLWAYMGGIARENGMKALAVGGMEDHAHLLLSLPASLSIAAAMRQIKSGSSRWMHETCGVPSFEWQEGYGAFSIGRSQLDATLAYISGQREHHRRRDFQAEFVAILKKHRIEYDPRYVWG